MCGAWRLRVVRWLWGADVTAVVPNIRQQCTCACHWLNRRTKTETRFTHTEPRRCCDGLDVLIRPKLTTTIHYEKPTITVKIVHQSLLCRAATFDPEWGLEHTPCSGTCDGHGTGQICDEPCQCSCHDYQR